MPESEKPTTGVWGQRHLWYIRGCHWGLYVGLQLSGKLDSYLANIDRQAEEMFLRLVNQIARWEDVTESLKVADQMAWVVRMNNIRERAAEIVNAELIYI